MKKLYILCEVDKLEQVRSKMKSVGILHNPLSSTGELPATHMYCVLHLNEDRIEKYLAIQEHTIMEVSELEEFLQKWNLKIIK